MRAPICRVVAEELPNIAGMGRGAPNQNPPLPPPDRAAQILRKPIRAFGRLGLRGVASVTEQLGFSSRLPSGYQGVSLGRRTQGFVAQDHSVLGMEWRTFMTSHACQPSPTC